MNELGDTQTCIIGNRPHGAEIGLLCNGHYARMSDTIRDIVTQTEQLSAVPSMAVQSGRGGSLASHRSPARLDVLALTDRRRNAAGLGDWDSTRYDDTPEVLDVLGSWGRIVWEECPALRDEHGLPRARTGAVTVVGEAQLLTTHREWMAGQNWIDEAFDDLRALLTVLKRVNGDPEDKPAAKCDRPQGDGPCNGPIWIDSVAAVARCGRCETEWSGATLVYLQKQMEHKPRPKTEDGRDWLSKAELAKKRKVSEATIPVWAHRAGLASVEGYYHPDLASPSVMSGS